MLGNRFDYNARSRYTLNSIQTKIKKEIEFKIKNEIYKFEKTNCDICGNTKFDLLSLKDRHGLFTPISICIQCGLIQTNPRMTEDSYIQFYEKEYRKLYLGTLHPSETFFNSQISKGREIYKFLKNTSVLSKLEKDSLIFEVGCGAGGILQFFREKGFKVQGCDLDKNYLSYGKNKHNLDLIYGTIQDIKLEKPIDLIIYCHVFEHVLSPKKELLKIRELLAPECYIYIEVPGIRNIINSHKRNSLAYLQNAHTYHFTLTSLTNLLNQNHFSLISGNEFIRSIFKKEKVSDNSFDFKKDYQTTLEYLHKLEESYLRKNFSTNKYLKLLPDSIFFYLRNFQEKYILLFHVLKKMLFKMLKKEIPTIIS